MRINMTDLEQMGKRAVEAKYLVQAMSAQEKDQVLLKAVELLLDQAEQEQILAANSEDVERAKANGMHPGLIDRLSLDGKRLEAMAEGLRQITELPDPIGEVLEEFVPKNGLHIAKVRVPIGVIGIIYESRPNVTADAFGLCFKAGNAVILKGGSDALHSNMAITKLLRKALASCGMAEDAIQLIQATERAVTTEFMRLNKYVDLLIPRGGAGLIRSVVENSTIPVIETGTGNCHIYIDKTADLTMAVNIVTNAKTQRIGVCNACESLVIHENVADQFLPLLEKRLREVHEVEIRGDETVCSILKEAVPATEEDYSREYLDYILSAKVVSGIDEAIAHINRCSTGHSEAIITSDQENAEKFKRQIDSACVYVNASTRFTDGFEFGFGAEIGISTQKLHARGPMGLRELTSYKYAIDGNGQVR